MHFRPLHDRVLVRTTEVLVADKPKAGGSRCGCAADGLLIALCGDRAGPTGPVASVVLSFVGCTPGPGSATSCG